MCGRFALSAPAENIRSHFALAEKVQLEPRYNIAPTQAVAVIRENNGDRLLSFMQWGLLPSWAKERKAGARMINARAETLAEKPAFRRLFRSQRCLIPADGFFEWREESGRKKKQPYFICLQPAGLFGFAGLWSSWQDPVSGEPVETCTIITTAANHLVSKIHHRMPAILVPDQYRAWLQPATPPAVAGSLLVPFESAPLQSYPVATLCNSPANDQPDCIRRA